MRNFQTERRPNPAEQYIYMGDGNKFLVEAVGVYSLKLDSSVLFLDLDETLYIPLFSIMFAKGKNLQ